MANTEACELFAAKNDNLQQPRRPLARVVILNAGGTSGASQATAIVWKVIASQQGWYHRHQCGRLVHQWAHAHRPASVKCPGCGGWVVAP